ncbi:MAG: addiction module protein [Bacteroidales bacterium]|nr:addiction module protein [Bacteroidales bacterium]MCF8456046.1 addiction module protein [Bacteroidales bacterium]
MEDYMNDIPEEHKKLLKERYQKMKDNPNSGIKWDTVKKELLQKYAV